MILLALAERTLYTVSLRASGSAFDRTKLHVQCRWPSPTQGLCVPSAPNPNVSVEQVLSSTDSFISLPDPRCESTELL